MTSISTPAHASRSHAAPSTPMRSISVTAIASPIWTHSIEPMAIRAPVRAWFVVTHALNGMATVHVHVIFIDIPFINHERSRATYAIGGGLSSSCRVSQFVFSRIRVSHETTGLAVASEAF
jgi:hypothetical protein